MEKVDWHIHSKFSDGQQTVPKLIEASKRLGLTSIAITDHFDPYDYSLCNREATDDELIAHLQMIREEGEKSGIKVFAGIETATGKDGALRLSDRVMSATDLIICSAHYVEHDDIEIVPGEVFNDRYWEAYKLLLLSQAENEADVAGHPEGYLPTLNMIGSTTFEERQRIRAEVAERYLDKEFYIEYGTRLKKSGKAFEIHGASGTPRKWVLDLLSSLGVSFSIGSDAHDLPLLGKNERAWALCEASGYMIKEPLGKRRFSICRK